MMRRPVFPEGVDAADMPLRLSPGVVSNGFLFLTGMTGSDADGTMPLDPEVQFRNAFDKIGAVLAAEGLGFDAVVELTSYHLNMAETFEIFEAVHASYLGAPFPAWLLKGCVPCYGF